VICRPSDPSACRCSTHATGIASVSCVRAPRHEHPSSCQGLVSPSALIAATSIHVVQKLAGHSDIQTTETYYLSVQPEDLAKARRMQSALVGDILSGVETDPLLTHF